MNNKATLTYITAIFLPCDEATNPIRRIPTKYFMSVYPYSLALNYIFHSQVFDGGVLDHDQSLPS